jgi:hypothetical protein
MKKLKAHQSRQPQAYAAGLTWIDEQPIQQTRYHTDPIIGSISQSDILSEVNEYGNRTG